MMRDTTLALRRFELERTEDVSGVSGTGVVAEGVQFSDGTVSLRWSKGEHPSTVVWGSIEDMLAVHGHGGTTTVAWLDTPEGLSPEFVEDEAKWAETVAMLHTIGTLHDRRSVELLRAKANQWLAGKPGRPGGKWFEEARGTHSRIAKEILAILDRKSV